MNVSKLLSGSFAVAVLGTLMTTSAMASCGGGSIEVTYAGKEQCVLPQQFATLSPAVQATADASDVAEAMGGDDDSSNSSADDNGTDDDSSSSADDDSSDDSGDDNSGGGSEGGDD